MHESEDSALVGGRRCQKVVEPEQPYSALERLVELALVGPPVRRYWQVPLLPLP